MTFTCDRCGASFSRKFNLKRHQASRCKQSVLMNKSTDAVEENFVQQPKDSQWSSFIDAVINKSPDDDNNNLIQPLKSVPIDQVGDNLTKIPDEKESITEILSPQQRVKKETLVIQDLKMKLAKMQVLSNIVL